MSDERSLDTRAVHAGEGRAKAHDSLTTPVALTSTYTFESAEALGRHHRREVEREEYGRYGNPTVRAAERKLADLDGAEDAALFASGMAAITTTLLAMLRSGHHVVLTRDCYRRTRQFVTAVLPRYGVESTVVEPGDPDAVARAIVPGKTRLVISESPTNPYLRVVDLEALRAIKAAHPSVKFLIDATFSTPVNQRPIEHGVDLVIHSATKYLGGHNDLLAGSVSGSAALIDAIRDFRGVLGGVLDPHAAYLLLRGVKTLGLRVARQNASALSLARALESDPRIERVFYPGLESHPDHRVAVAQMSGFGGVVSFLVKGDGPRTERFVDACRIAAIAPSLGGVETLIEQPALMSYYEMSPDERLAVGIPDNLVRLAVGIESCDDLLDDLARALDAAFAA
ncbi:MAG: PLP-dependent aspartate aminotransferase family protein [Deltaproteobacteria bacterium]|nr:PLP-dependent aspartate aminotransferase family protein [Myxococcales bacterium]MDP3218402.1 PLP-dependent aspartate aminotransferase family protein [Deltaproteobacteria bacterium]